MMAGTSSVIVDNHVTLEMDSIQALALPTSSFVSVGEKNQVYLAKVMVVLLLCNMHPNLILILLCFQYDIALLFCWV